MDICTKQTINTCAIHLNDLRYDLIGHVCQPSVTNQQYEQSRQIMCYVYCKELKGWCKSFTRIEGLLSILEAILLVVLIVLLVFLILHFGACRNEESKNIQCETDQDPVNASTPNYTSTPAATTTSATTTSTVVTSSTLSPDVECTWEPSRKTSAATHYYLTDIHNSRTQSRTTSFSVTKDKSTTSKPLKPTSETPPPTDEYDDVDFLEPMEGETAEDEYKSQVVALVKLKPAGDVTFGCILTKITNYWTLTAASCIESIEEVDSLDSFVIMEEWGEAGQSRPRTVADVRVHPRRATASPGEAAGDRAAGDRAAGDGAADRHHDLAALRSDRALRGDVPPLRLPRLIDYFLIAIGERFLILGYGGFRTEEGGRGARRLRQVGVRAVPAAQCGGGERRHLAGGAPLRHAACGAAPLCAAVRARSAPCRYCAGAPLLRGATLLGIMSDDGACGLACEPQLYVNIATVRDWIDSLVH